MNTNEPNSNTGLQKMKSFFSENYFPTTEMNGSLQMTTQEVTDRLNKIVPGEVLTCEIVYNWLTELGFLFAEMGSMNIKWLIKKK